jgi:hypothetical protein
MKIPLAGFDRLRLAGMADPHDVNPADPGLYGKRSDRVPKFGEDQILNPHAIGLLADWLRGEWYETKIAESGR